MGVLDDIRADLIDSSADTKNTLRKALVLAHEVHSVELRQWVMSELNGYSIDDTIPSYRRVPLPVFGMFVGAARQARNVLLTTSGLPNEIKDSADYLLVLEGIAALEDIQATGEKELQRTLMPEMTELLRENQYMSGMVLFQAYQRVPRQVFAEVVDTVKTRLLEFALELQNNSLTPETLSTGEIDDELIRKALNVHIYGNNNVVAVGEKVHQEVGNVNHQDLDSLLSHLRGHDVSDDDLAALKQDILSETTPSTGDFGPKVSSWVERMVSKAASGAWNVSMAVAPRILQKAITSYYGGSP